MLGFISLLRISRPRFWLYLLGPFLIGSIPLFQMVDNPVLFILGFLFFLLPANILLYGINDLADQDTDKYNTKKGSYEHKLLANDLSLLKFSLVLSGVMAFGYFMLLPFLASVLFMAFIFLSYSYSALPLRFKSRPVIDSVSNILYALPGFIAYAIATNSLPPIWVWLAAGLWTTAMHLFSAIPDITADTKAGLKTSAIMFGKHNSLVITSLLWLTAGITIFINTKNIFLTSLMLVYVILPILVIYFNQNLTKIYKIYPFINGIIGFMLFWYLTLKLYGFI